jgi:hypothetical protein
MQSRSRGCFGSVVMLVLGVLGAFVLLVAVLVVGDEWGRTSGVIAGLMALIVITAARPYAQMTRDLRRASSARRTAAWAMSNGWTRPSRSVWPWKAGTVIVGTAFSASMTGMPITIGEVTWSHDGLGGVVDASQGSGVFALVELPHAYPSAAVQRRRDFRRDHRHEDRFDQIYRVVLDDTYFAEQIRGKALRRAHLRGEIPPWQIVGDELILVEYGNLSPGNVRTLQKQAAKVVDLLQIRMLTA